MIAYDKTILDNEVLGDEADTLYNGGFISKEQKKFIEKELPFFKSQKNILVRLGFFLLGSFLYSSICGVISLFALNGDEDVFFKIYCYLFAIVGFAGTEFLARQNYHNHGLDDSFILGALLTLGIGIAVTTEGYEVVIAFFVAVAALFMFLRYLHVLSMLVFCFALTAFLFYGMFEFGEIGKAILPFTAMIFAAVFYFVSKKMINSLTKSYYYNGLLLVNSFCLVLFYLSCNYLVVRELSAELLGIDFKPGEDIPFAFFFYAFTFIVPIVYLFQALRTKDRIMLWINFAVIAFAIYTIRYYYSVMPIEIALTLGGIVLFAIAYFSIRKLKEKESGLTFKPDRINHSDSILNAEALIVASTFGMKPQVPTDSPMKFGDGGFSGGGSGGTF